MIEIARFKCVGRLPMKAELVPLVTSGKKTRTVRSCPKGIATDGDVPRLVGKLNTGRWLWRQNYTVIVKPLRTRDRDCLSFGPDDYIYMQEPIHKSSAGLVTYSCDFVTVTSAGCIGVRWGAKPNKLPAMNMGSRFARTILQIKSVKFEVLGDMTGVDAAKEGVYHTTAIPHYHLHTGHGNTIIAAFANYWDTLANTKAERWEAMQDQLVRVIEFKVVATAATPWDLAKGVTI